MYGDIKSPFTLQTYKVILMEKNIGISNIEVDGMSNMQ
jgi:hypothetical protein